MTIIMLTEYGPVTSLRANLTSEGTSMSALVSWDPPGEDKIFRAPLFYHVALYQLDADSLKVGGGSVPLYFSVSPGQVVSDLRVFLTPALSKV